MPFAKATKQQSRLRLALVGPSGSGKTYSALAIAMGLGSRIASAAANSNYGRAWAYVISAIIVGLAFYLIVLAVERWTTPWTGHAQRA